jgi:hypothetical protein
MVAQTPKRERSKVRIHTALGAFVVYFRVVSCFSYYSTKTLALTLKLNKKKMRIGKGPSSNGMTSLCRAMGSTNTEIM